MKRTLRRVLNKNIKGCRKCPELNRKGVTESAPGYGDINSPVMMIGQSLCTACMETQIPFTGGSGLILDEVFRKVGVSKDGLFTTNLVHCHPINNRASKPQEIKNCLPYLWEEIQIVNPLLVLGFGRDVLNTLTGFYPFNQLGFWVNGGFKGRHTLFVYHPAYYWRRSGLHGKETKEYIDYLVHNLRRFV